MVLTRFSVTLNVKWHTIDPQTITDCQRTNVAAVTAMSAVRWLGSWRIALSPERMLLTIVLSRCNCCQFPSTVAIVSGLVLGNSLPKIYRMTHNYQPNTQYRPRLHATSRRIACKRSKCCEKLCPVCLRYSVETAKRIVIFQHLIVPLFQFLDARYLVLQFCDSHGSPSAGLKLAHEGLKVKGPRACYSATHTQSQQRFTISEVAADRHELMIPPPRRIMRPSIASKLKNYKILQYLRKR